MTPFNHPTGDLLEKIQQLEEELEHERKKRKENLINATRRLDDIISNISDGFYNFDKEWRFRYINGEGERQFKKPKEELLGKCCWELYPDTVGTKVYLKYHEAIRNQIPVNFELEGNINDGIWYEVHAYPTHDGLSVFCRDISEKKNYERQMSRFNDLNLVGQMSAGISHEVRNPMTTVRGFLQLLSGREEYEKDKDYFLLMIEELDRANGIISEFLSLANNTHFEPKEICLNEMLDTLYPLLSAHAIKSDVNIILKKGDIPKLLLDQKEIRQMILNLFKNGLEAMGTGGNLTLETSSKGKEVILKIADQGAGIPKELQDKLGTPFLTTKDTGTGLGLSICFSIAKRHNAKIDFKSSSKGTIVNIRFKIKTRP